MHNRYRLGLLVMAAALATLPQLAAAQRPPQPRGRPDFGIPLEIPVPAYQRNQSHGEIEHAATSEDLLDQRLHRLKDVHNLEELIKKILTDPKKYPIDPQTIEKLQRDQAQSNGKAVPDLSDPKLRSLVDTILAEHDKQGLPKGTISLEQLEALKRLRPAQAEESRQSTPATPGEGRPARALPPDVSRPAPERARVEPSGPVAPDEPASAEPTAENKRHLSPQVAEQFRKFLDRVRAWNPALQKSPALRQAMRSLQRYTPANDRWSGLASQVDSFQERFGDWTGKARLERLEAGMDWLSPRNLTPRSLPGLGWLGGRGSWGQMPSWSAPTISTPQASGEAAGWGLVWILVLGGAGLIGWKVFAWRQADAARARKTGSYGSWPIHPAAIQTAEELIRAFEHLAVLRLGTPARSWNHLAIAAGLAGEPAAAVEAKLTASLPPAWKEAADQLVEVRPRAPTSEEHRQTASHLAALYEQARYAPPGNPLSDAVLAVARHELCFLGGVPAT